MGNPEADALKGKYFGVLDHGFVALVDYMGDDAAVVQAARVSYGAGTKTVNEDRGVLRYMTRHTHTSPFEMVELKFHVRLPIFVARQLIRHRTANVNEYSLRYSLPSMQFYMPDPANMGTQSKKNKQGRALAVGDSVGMMIETKWRELQKESMALYELMVSEEVDLARELARMHLPLSLYTEWYWKIDLHNLLHYLKLRCDGHAQWEIQQVSRIKAAIAKVVAPAAFEAWIDYSFQARTFSRMEMLLLRSLLVTLPGEDGTSSRRLDSLGYALPQAHASALGMSQREWDELTDLFEPGNDQLYKVTDFALDLSSAKTAEYFAEEVAKYLPKQT